MNRNERAMAEAHLQRNHSLQANNRNVFKDILPMNDNIEVLFMAGWDELLLETKDVKEKLMNIEQYLPDGLHIPEAYTFARLIADYLPDDEVTPSGFYHAAAISALGAITRGVNKNGEVIANRIYPDDTMRQKLLLLDISKIAASVCPKMFSDSVKEYSTDMYKLMKHKR